jgi:ABC-type sugar transport system substrate-binding protein
MRQAMIEQGRTSRIKVLWKGLEDSGPKQDRAAEEIKQVREMLDDGVQVLIFKSADPKSAYPILQEAQKRQIPVITLDRLIVGMPVRGHITVNEIGLGEVAAQHALEQIGYKGNVLILEGPTGVESFRSIALGIYRVLDQYPNTIRIHSYYTPLNVEAAFQMTDQVLKNYAGNIQAVIAVDSVLAVGAARGAHLHGLSEEVVTVGVGAGEEACHQIMQKRHDAEVDLMPYERGEQALQAAISVSNGESFPSDVELPSGKIFTRTLFTPVRIITPANYLEVERMWPNLFVQKK